MASCPFCSDVLLRHIRSGQAYWLCRRCRTEILEQEFGRTNEVDLKQRAVVKDGVFSVVGHVSPKVKISDLPMQMP
ncbi:hypothetical protein OsccyDRAFT_3076 [Leptolyngbyaceae cyanobacterium JSC-12]|nr:hypothetical protein OsccyDRAFT_3076 [Leptolyngbyaceae cyanobacterium JSC-12]